MGEAKRRRCGQACAGALPSDARAGLVIAPGALARLPSSRPLTSYDCFVVVVRPPLEPCAKLLDLIGRPGSVCALLTHELGMAWPDKRGIGLIEGVLAQSDGVAILGFEGLSDALACKRRLQAEMGLAA